MADRRKQKSEEQASTKTAGRGRPPRRERDFAAIRSGEDGDFRHRILDAAAEIFSERGFAAASIDEVAKRLGATKGLVYHRYRSKGELLADVCEDGLATLTANLDEIASQPQRAMTRLTAAAVFHAGHVLGHIALHRTLLEATTFAAAAGRLDDGSLSIEDISDQRGAYDAAFTRLIADAAAQNDLPSGRDTAMLGRIFVGALDAPLRWPAEIVDELAENRDLIARQLAYFAIRGVGASEATLKEEFSR